MADVADVKHTTEVASNITRACEHCDQMVGSGTGGSSISDSVNHYIKVHGYQLLHVGTETSHDVDGRLWHSTVAILGHHNPPPPKPLVEISIKQVIVAPNAE